MAPLAWLLLLGKPLPSDSCIQPVHPTIWHHCLSRRATSQHGIRIGNEKDKNRYYPVTYKRFSENLRDSDFWETKNRISPLKLLYAHVLVTTRYHIHTFKYAKTPISKPHLWLQKRVSCVRPGQDRAWQIRGPRPAGSGWCPVIFLRGRVPGRQYDQWKGFYRRRFENQCKKDWESLDPGVRLSYETSQLVKTRSSGVNKKKAHICL